MVPVQEEKKQNSLISTNLQVGNENETSTKGINQLCSVIKLGYKCIIEVVKVIRFVHLFNELQQHNATATRITFSSISN